MVFASVFALVVGVGMIGQWIFFLATGQVPELEIVHGAMLLVAGAFLLTPGIITDAVGLALLVPWIREFLRIRFFRSPRVVVW